MESTLYKLPTSVHLPVFNGSYHWVVPSKNEFEKGNTFLYLQDFDLKEKNLTPYWRPGPLKSVNWRYPAIPAAITALAFVTSVSLFSLAMEEPSAGGQVAAATLHAQSAFVGAVMTLMVSAIAMLLTWLLWQTVVVDVEKATDKALEPMQQLFSLSPVSWGQARKEFVKTGKVKGSMFLTPDLKKVWISHYDLKFLEVVL